MAIERQMSTLPPAQPSYILRGHASQIHSVQFARLNTRLITGDADGWIIYWKLETKRALAVIWQVRSADESALSTALPAEVSHSDRPMPWLLHTLPVNTLNFCAFSMCYASVQAELHGSDDAERDTQSRPEKTHASVLIVVPARDDKKAEVYQFPEEKLSCVVPHAQTKDTGMVMAVKLVRDPITQRTLVITGYEGGLTAVHLLPEADNSTSGMAQLVYLSQPHTQPVLSIDVLPDAKTYYTSGADAIIAAHRIPDLSSRGDDVRDSLSTQGDEDGPPVSVPSQNSDALAPTTSQATTERYCTDKAADNPPVSIPEDVDDQPLLFSKNPVQSSIPTKSAPKAGGLSSLLSNATPLSRAAQSAPQQPSPPSIQAPFKVQNTKHAGQQSLSARSDGRLLATGGWDSRVRIYSAKTLKEVAVLKWHKEGVYAVAFGKILDGIDLEHNARDSQSQDVNREVAKRETGLGKLQRQREEKMQVKHWIAAGAKDGKISLWEVF
ncbi:WD40 repeat-like protein [Didymella exigua CBS 183.55]|uniref:ASTRA-associated protein 1 n=1 Tax=Didymella exigua CBS 183.55 TaxID=1150837 RepID=A0A6A5RKB6_9PLEO|nr:WD40 repeat-like protein [Didymella exigua CBS 183.55]KAF1927893.1 WD40 repeat-like protein [Didymella exigua CBS 183.55]